MDTQTMALTDPDTPLPSTRCEWCPRLEGLALPRVATIAASVTEEGFSPYVAYVCDECVDTAVPYGVEVIARGSIPPRMTWAEIGLSTDAATAFDAANIPPADLLAYLGMGSRWTGGACGCRQTGGCPACRQGLTHDAKGCLCTRELVLNIVAD